jgi:hypothetical protein
MCTTHHYTTHHVTPHHIPHHHTTTTTTGAHVSSEATYLSPAKLPTELERAAACMVASFPQAKLTQDAMYKVMREYHTTFRTATGVPVKSRTRKPKAGQAPPGPKVSAAQLFPLATLQFTYI